MALRSVSPTFSNRSSPPITRSVSRNGSRHLQPAPAGFDTSTPLTRRSIQPGMHVETIERVFESADETDVNLNSSQFIYKEHFTVTEMTSMKKEMWYDWLKYRIRMLRRRFIPSMKTFRELLTIVLLVTMTCYYLRDNHKTETENSNNQFYVDAEQKFHKSISNLKSDFHNFEKRINLRVESIENQLEVLKGWNDSVMLELQNIKFSQTDLAVSLQNLKTDLNIEKQKISEVISVEPIVVTPPATELQMHAFSQSSINRRPLPGVNVANSLIGASIDESCSSRTASAKDGIFYDVMSYVVSFQEGYVLLDRDVLSPGEAWCTYDQRPTLTVKLARYILPTAVSYQHVRWNGIVPNHAPKLYDLVACRSPCCTQWEPLITNCEYKPSLDGQDDQEQFCSVPSTVHSTPINHVQFRFRENHGNMTKTCAYLVRVYGDPVDGPEEEHSSTDNGTGHLETEFLNASPTQTV
uniref:SUN domain-containing protein n=1 Tax=Caenorhabditis japonica TaxID=281687 RepID=A0A8R1HNN2_CAEJA